MVEHIEQQEQVSDSQKFFNWITGNVSVNSRKELEKALESVEYAIDRMNSNKELSSTQWNQAQEAIRMAFTNNLKSLILKGKLES